MIFKDVYGHYFEHSIGVESDHLSSLLRLTVQKYLDFLLKTYGKIHWNGDQQKCVLYQAYTD